MCCLSCSRYHDQVSYRWSMLSVSVSFTHTIKTLGPMFTVLFSRLLLSERMPCSRLLSVLPVVLGVAITTSTEVEFALVPPTHTHHPRRAWLRQRGVARHRWASTRSTAALPTAQPSPVPSSPARAAAQPSARAWTGGLLLCGQLYRMPGAHPRPATSPTQPQRCLRPHHSQALQSVLSKQALADGRVSKPELFCVAAQYALLLLLPLFILLEAWRLTRSAA